MARCYRKHSLVIDFTSIPEKNTLEQVRSFVFDNLELNISQVKNLQLSMTNARVFLEMGSTEQAEALVLKHHLKHALQADSLDYAFPLYMADGSVEVKVYDLPPYLPNGTIAKHLSAFGEVLSIKDDVWQKFFPGVPNGTRTVRMKLKKSIPSHVNMEDECAQSNRHLSLLRKKPTHRIQVLGCQEGTVREADHRSSAASYSCSSIETNRLSSLSI
ncbi:hypothetical protein quinque_008784 [Culex quinquefasciatus]